MSTKEVARRGDSNLPEHYATLEVQLNAIPEAVDDDDATERIFATLDQAQRPEDLNRPWDASGLKALNGHVIRIRELSRRASDKSETVPWYLMIKGTDGTTGEQITVTCGASNVLKQLAVAYANGWFPSDWKVEVNQTKSGNDVFRLHYEGRPATTDDGSEF